MPAYRFEALDAQGRTTKGVIEADTVKSARSNLRQQLLVPLRVDAVSATDGDAAAKSGSGLFNARVLSTTGLTIWTRQLAGLVSAGLPLERALSALMEESEDERQHNLVAALRSEVNAGSTFAKALGRHPREFSEVYRSVIAAGEQSGDLGLVLERLADDQESSQALKSKVLAAALYPAIVSLIAFAIVIFLLTYVVPQVAGVFTSSKRALPLITTVMLAIASFVRGYGWLMLLAAVVGGFALAQAWRSASLGSAMDAAWLRIPIIGPLARRYNAARFASTLAMLCAAGVPILRALAAAAETLSNRAMKQDAQDALILVREGAPLASALATKKRFPGMISMFARLGEQTGQLPLMLQRAATQLGGEVQRRALQLATILEPLLIVAMGGVVMLIVLAVLMPIIQLNTFVK